VSAVALGRIGAVSGAWDRRVRDDRRAVAPTRRHTTRTHPVDTSRRHPRRDRFGGGGGDRRTGASG